MNWISTTSMPLLLWGYRVNNRQTTQFRIWATQTQKVYYQRFCVRWRTFENKAKTLATDHFDELLAYPVIFVLRKTQHQKIRGFVYVERRLHKTDKKPNSFCRIKQITFATTKHTAAEIIVQHCQSRNAQYGFDFVERQPCNVKKT